MTLTSGVLAVELAGVAESNAPFSVPEPISIALLSTSLVSFGLVRKNKHG
ncbi:MAG: PEP-CTERM sorting domain-containing protein [Janthinobacterium lividum]